jgi:GTP cyclohydrolase I
MHAPVKVDGPAVGGTLARRPARHTLRPSRGQAEIAVRTLIRSAGDHPYPEGLIDIPTRVVRAYEQWYAGHAEDPGGFLQRTFAEVAGYDEAVVLASIGLCPIASTTWCRSPAAHIGYLPRDRIVGISKSPAS